MSTHIRRTLAAALALVAAASVAVPAGRAGAQDGEAAPVPQAEVKAARGLVKTFSQELKGELTAAIKDGGPTHAIGVCNEVAPEIGGKLSADSAWSIGRTALKVRNPRNSPSPRERAVLKSFQRRHANGEGFKNMEHAAIIDEGGQRYIHYMKAIPTQEACLACHGTNVKENVLSAIDENYPADAATGFEEGELRGAFTLVKPLPTN
ncbi:Tll0287-like domain-containing protein [Rhodovibrio sodomensis]|nr:DUF3365 domain-containing protein [Rhodovibrio sodomensis]